MKKVVIILTVLLTVVAGVWIGLMRNQPTEPSKTIDDRILEAIVRDFPVFSSDGKPVIGIDSISQHDEGWYIATIKSLRPIKNVVPVKVILRDDGEWIRTVAGPDTYFPESDMITLNLPDSVILELKKQ